MFTIYVFTISLFRSPVYKDINKSLSAMSPMSVVRRRRIMRHNYGCLSLRQRWVRRRRREEERELCLACCLQGYEHLNAWKAVKLFQQLTEIRAKCSQTSPLAATPPARHLKLHIFSMPLWAHSAFASLRHTDRGGAKALEIIFMSSAFNGRQWTQVDNR